MFPIPPVPLFEVAGHSLGPWHLLPPTHVVEAMRMTLTHGQPWISCAFQLIATIALSFIYLPTTTNIFQRVRMRTEYR